CAWEAGEGTIPEGTAPSAGSPRLSRRGRRRELLGRDPRVERAHVVGPLEGCRTVGSVVAHAPPELREGLVAVLLHPPELLLQRLDVAGPRRRSADVVIATSAPTRSA